MTTKSETAAADVPLASDVLLAAKEYGDAFLETDPKAMSDRREEAHRRLCLAARRYAIAVRS